MMAKKTQKERNWIRRNKTQKKKNRKSGQTSSPYLVKKDRLDREAREKEE